MVAVDPPGVFAGTHASLPRPTQAPRTSLRLQSLCSDGSAAPPEKEEEAAPERPGLAHHRPMRNPSIVADDPHLRAWDGTMPALPPTNAVHGEGKMTKQQTQREKEKGKVKGPQWRYSTHIQYARNAYITRYMSAFPDDWHSPNMINTPRFFVAFIFRNSMQKKPEPESYRRSGRRTPTPPTEFRKNDSNPPVNPPPRVERRQREPPKESKKFPVASWKSVPKIKISPEKAADVEVSLVGGCRLWG